MSVSLVICGDLFLHFFGVGLVSIDKPRLTALFAVSAIPLTALLLFSKVFPKIIFHVFFISANGDFHVLQHTCPNSWHFLHRGTPDIFVYSSSVFFNFGMFMNLGISLSKVMDMGDNDFPPFFLSRKLFGGL